MQTSKVLLVICTAMGCAGSIALAATNSFPQPPARMSNQEAERLREALRQKIAELDAQEKTGQPAFPPVALTPAQKSPDTISADVIKAEREALAAEQKRLDDEAKATRAKVKSAKSKLEQGTVAQTAPFAPVEPPPSAVPATKEAQLADLLRKYKTDAITPAEYHKERAKLLAGP